MSVAVIILTFNEEENLGPAIESVRGWAHEIFVVDSFSVDRTIEQRIEQPIDRDTLVFRRQPIIDRDNLRLADDRIANLGDDRIVRILRGNGHRGGEGQHGGKADGGQVSNLHVPVLS